MPQFMPSFLRYLVRTVHMDCIHGKMCIRDMVCPSVQQTENLQSSLSFLHSHLQLFAAAAQEMLHVTQHVNMLDPRLISWEGSVQWGVQRQNDAWWMDGWMDGWIEYCSYHAGYKEHRVLHHSTMGFSFVRNQESMSDISSMTMFVWWACSGDSADIIGSLCTRLSSSITSSMGVSPWGSGLTTGLPPWWLCRCGRAPAANMSLRSWAELFSLVACVSPCAFISISSSCNPMRSKVKYLVHMYWYYRQSCC